MQDFFFDRLGIVEQRGEQDRAAGKHKSDKQSFHGIPFYIRQTFFCRDPGVLHNLDGAAGHYLHNLFGSYLRDRICNGSRLLRVGRGHGHLKDLCVINGGCGYHSAQLLVRTGYAGLLDHRAQSRIAGEHDRIGIDQVL